MEPLSKVLVQKYIPEVAKVKPSNLVTDAEYKIVQSAGLDDVFSITEKNPTVLERICVGEKLQTSEFYDRQEKTYNRNVAQIYRKPRATSPAPRTVPATRTDPPQAPGVSGSARDVVPVAVQQINDVMEPARSSDGSIHPTPPLPSPLPPKDPYQLPERDTASLAALSVADMMRITDDNFGSEDADGARDFLELCTGHQLPPMSLRESGTRDMLVAQFPGSLRRSAAPMVDNFEPCDFSAFKRSSSKRRPDAELATATTGAQQDLAALKDLAPQQQNIPTTDEAVPPPAAANAAQPTAMPVVESSSSAEDMQVAVARPRRTRRDIAFTQVLESFESIARKMPPLRRETDIFCLPYRPLWNKTIQDVQNQLAKMYEQQQQKARQQQQEQQELQQMREAVMPAVSGTANVDDGRRNITPEIRRTVAGLDAMTMDEQSRPINSVVEAKATPDLVGQVDQLESFDGKLPNMSAPDQLPALAGDTAAILPDSSGTKTRAKKQQVSETQEMEAKIPTPSDVPLTTSSQFSDKSRKRAQKMTTATNDERCENNVNNNDVSTALYNQAKECGAIPSQEDVVKEPLDELLIHIIIAVQSLIAKQRLGRDGRVSLNSVQQYLGLNSRNCICRIFKNMLLLKQAGLLELSSDSINCPTHVGLKFPDQQNGSR